MAYNVIINEMLFKIHKMENCDFLNLQFIHNSNMTLTLFPLSV